MATEIVKVPNIGDVDSAEIIEVSVKIGDVIGVDDTLIVLETDKASMEVPSPMAGKVTQIKAAEGQAVSEGDDILFLEIEGQVAQETPAQEAPAVDSHNLNVAAVSAPQTVVVPDIGSDGKVDCIEVCVKVGDKIEADDSIVVLETDKASMEVPAPFAGEVISISVKAGDQVEQGDLLIEVRGEASDAPVASAAPAPQAAAPSAAPVEAVETISIPDIGTDGDVELIEISIKVGDEINADDPVVTLETDKASMEVPAPKGGTVESILVNVGDTVKQGTDIFTLKTTSAPSAAPAPVATPAPAAKATSAPTAPAKAAAAQNSGYVKPSKDVHAGPAVRRLAREFGVDLGLIATTTGPKGRILKDDVASYVKKRLQEPASTGGAGIAPIPDQDFSKYGDVEIKKLARIQEITAQNMTRNWLNIPHVTVFDEADVTELEAFRASLKKEAEKRGSKLSSLAFVVKACAAALNEYPQFNVSLLADGKQFVQKKYVNIGIAVATPTGLIVPVIKDADKKSVWDIADEIIDLATRGRKGQVKADEMKGGCFTISSLGGLGSTAFTPIVNAPEVAILGLSNNQTKPFWDGSQFVPRNFLPMSLSFDHRAINGADAAIFSTFVKKALTDLRRLVL